jgi:DnaJ-class molecular chaperone
MTFREVACGSCGGSGKSMLLDPSGVRELSCSACKGTGICYKWVEAEPKEVKHPPKENTSSCSNCGGTGKERCIRCEGTGKVVNMIGGPLGTSSWTGNCPECSGNREMACRACNGSGVSLSKPLRPSRETCNKCYGSGKVRCESYLCRGTGRYMGPTGLVICSMCSGSGQMRCDRCGGLGH